MPSNWPSPRVVYARQYNIKAMGLEKLHPFDSRKYGRAWVTLRRSHRELLRAAHIRPKRPITEDELLRVHSTAYLERLRDSAYLANVLEVPVSRVPGWLVDRLVLRPMRWATMGTILAARAAMQHGLAINLGGGYHHASPDDGHGFCVYADIALAIDDLRRGGQLSETNKVVYIDTDAHRGDGVCHSFAADPRVFIYDQYNWHIFPNDPAARRRIDCDVHVGTNIRTPVYLEKLKTRLPPFLHSLSGVKFAIYNAGTDIFTDDQLGSMDVSAEGVQERDRFVLQQLMGLKIPTAVLTSGGYSKESYKLIAAMVSFALTEWA